MNMWLKGVNLFIIKVLRCCIILCCRQKIGDPDFNRILINYIDVQKRVVSTKSVEYMPFLLSFFLFLNGAIWSVYALLARDYFVAVSITVSVFPAVMIPVLSRRGFFYIIH